MKFRNPKAFSYMEISVVILLIGLLIAGITKGTSMIDDFRLQTARSLTKSAPMTRMQGMTLWLDTVSKESFDIEVDVSDSTKNKVSAWNDLNPLSNSRLDFIQPTSSLQATLVNDPKMNNLPVFLFDGVDDNFYRLNVLGSDFTQKDEITIFFVQRFEPNINGSIFTWYPSSSGQRLLHHSHWSDGNAYFDFGDPAGGNGRVYKSINGSSYLNVGNITTLIHKSRGVGNISINGHKLFSPDAPQVTVVDVTASSTFYIGSYQNTITPFKGYLGEVIIFNRALKDGEVASIEKYLSQKWGIKLVP